MKQFLQKSVFILTVLGIVLGGVEFYARSIDTSSLKSKCEYLNKNKNEIEGIVLGPSHSMRGINPAFFDRNVATLALPGCPFSISYLFFEKFKHIPNLKFVILDLSKGILSTSLSDSWLKKERVGYYFSLDLEEKSWRDYFYIQYPLRNIFNQKRRGHPTNKWGFYEKVKKRGTTFKKEGLDSIRLAETHERKKGSVDKFFRDYDDSVYKDNVIKLQNIVAYTKANGIKLFLISPPKYYIFNELINSRTLLMEKRDDAISDLIDNQTVYFWDYQETYQNKPDIFNNINHLNVEGAEFFTKELNHRIEKEFK